MGSADFPTRRHAIAKVASPWGAERAKHPPGTHLMRLINPETREQSFQTVKLPGALEIFDGASVYCPPLGHVTEEEEQAFLLEMDKLYWNGGTA